MCATSPEWRHLVNACGVKEELNFIIDAVCTG